MKSVDTRGAFEILLLQAIYGQSLAGSSNLVMWAFSTLSHHHRCGVLKNLENVSLFNIHETLQKPR
jgi:hypothetical protein